MEATDCAMEGTVNWASREDGRPALAGTCAGGAATGATATTTGAGTGAGTGAVAGLETALAGVLTGALATGLTTAGAAAFLTISFTGLAALFGDGFWFFDTSTAFTAGILEAEGLGLATGLTGWGAALAGALTAALATTLGVGLDGALATGLGAGLATGLVTDFGAGLATAAALAGLTGFELDLTATGALLTFDFTSVLLAECACACAGIVASPLGCALATRSVVIPSLLDFAGWPAEFSLARECTGFAKPKPIN